MKNKILKIAGIVVIVLILIVAGFAIYLKTALPNVGAAPKIKITATPAMVKRGAYLANHVTVCMDCHSERDWTRFSGPIVDGTLGKGGEKFDEAEGLPGTIYSKNITPSNLKNWTDGEIYRCITTGVTNDGEALFPLMPYKSYSRMDPRDVKAIIAYIRTLTPIKHKIPERHLNFPMNFIVNTIPTKANPMTRPPKSDTLAYGKYLTTIAGCGECHTKIVKGKVVGKPFAGGRVFKLPDGSIVRSDNITPDMETGKGSWNVNTFISVFKTRKEKGLEGEKVNPPQTIMPWTMYGGMDSTDLAAIFDYLHHLKPVKNKVIFYTPANEVKSGDK